MTLDHQWIQVQNLSYDHQSQAVSAVFFLPKDSLFFEGHFPGRPIVPGIAFLSMVEKGLCALPPPQPWLCGFRRIRFRALVDSGGMFELALARNHQESDSELTVHILHNGNKICDGLALTSTPVPLPLTRSVLNKPPMRDLNICAEDYIPHRRPMRILGAIVEIQESQCVSTSLVDESWPLCMPDGLSPVVCVELAAQTAATHIGWKRRHQESCGGRGLLVGVKKARFSSVVIPKGEQLTSRVSTILQQDNYLVFDATIEGQSGFSAQLQFQAFRV